MIILHETAEGLTRIDMDSIATWEPIHKFEQYLNRYERWDTFDKYHAAAIKKGIPAPVLIGGDLDTVARACQHEVVRETEVMISHLRDGKGSLVPFMRMSPEGVYLTRDDIPERLVNCMTGKPYPEPPEGQRRFRVSIIFPGASYSDFHHMAMGATPKEAVQAEIARMHKQAEDAEAKGGFFMDFRALTISHTMATDVDTGEAFHFAGPDGVTENEESKYAETVMNGFLKMFGA